MDESAADRLRSRLSARGPDALGELAQFLLDNPWLNQALSVALEARERAQHASQNAMRNVGVPTSGDVDRLGRRLRALSERLESVEDAVDRLEDQVRDLKRASTPARDSAPD
ncbi:MAG: hypothetical protein ACRDKH_03520 [Solirubrobacterales bacterium]